MANSEFTQEEIDSYQAKVMHLLETEKEIDKIKQLISTKVEESNWLYEVKKMSGKKMDEESIEELTPESVTEMILDQAMNALPEQLQATVEKYITDALTKKKISADSLSSPK